MMMKMMKTPQLGGDDQTKRERKEDKFFTSENIDIFG
jgi:hypothetical protein